MRAQAAGHTALLPVLLFYVSCQLCLRTVLILLNDVDVCDCGCVATALLVSYTVTGAVYCYCVCVT